MSPSSLNIAYVDDEKDMLMIINAVFAADIKSGKIKLKCFESGVDLIDYIRREDPPPPFSLVFSDINMPGMNGFEVLETLRASYPTIDVVIVSGYDRKDYQDKAMKMGAKDFIPKPFDVSRLRESLKT